jgi:hypothetical protein
MTQLFVIPLNRLIDALIRHKKQAVLSRGIVNNEFLTTSTTQSELRLKNILGARSTASIRNKKGQTSTYKNPV